jgi:hypothetical protein
VDRDLIDAYGSVIRFLNQPRSIAAVLIAATCLTPAHAQLVSTFGKTVSYGAVPSSGLAGDTKRTSAFTLTEPATITELCAYLDGNGGASDYQWGSSVARDYSDNRPVGDNLASRLDTFPDGADDLFYNTDPILKRVSATLSVYASYSLPPPESARVRGD